MGVWCRTVSRQHPRDGADPAQVGRELFLVLLEVHQPGNLDNPDHFKLCGAQDAGGENPFSMPVQGIGFAILLTTYAILLGTMIYLLATTKDKMALFKSVEQKSS